MLYAVTSGQTIFYISTGNACCPPDIPSRSTNNVIGQSQTVFTTHKILYYRIGARIKFFILITRMRETMVVQFNKRAFQQAVVSRCLFNTSIYMLANNEHTDRNLLLLN